MPRGNPRVWQADVGKSFAELSHVASGPATSPQPGPQNVKAMPPAGNPSHYRHRGAGSFAFDTFGGFSVAPPPPAGRSSHPAPKCTEIRTAFLPPPSDRERSYPVKPNMHQFPAYNQPTEYKTLKQNDFPPDLLKRPDFERPKPARLKDSGRLLPRTAPNLSTQPKPKLPTSPTRPKRSEPSAQQVTLQALAKPTTTSSMEVRAQAISAMFLMDGNHVITGGIDEPPGKGESRDSQTVVARVTVQTTH